jgi:hypothetical protein
MSARGVLYVHSCPPALCPHVEWAVSGVLGVPVTLSWTAQPALPGTLRAECNWRGKPGTAGQIAAAMKSWTQLRVEVTEEPSVGCDGERYALAPDLGLFRTTVSVTGDLMIGEDRLRALLATATDGVALAHGLDRLLGTAWDEDLEPFRYAGEGAPVRWLHQAM